ncbi:MAG: hypothetical protein HY831_01305 [Candidatus Aenigmarchaeota archaeon]|nr:hypothetical protein [Candidatus Aenigmarchaeota archaeon]
MSWLKTTLLALGTVLVLAIPGYTGENKTSYTNNEYLPRFYSRGQNRDLETGRQLMPYHSLKFLGRDHDGVGRLPENSAKLVLDDSNGAIRTFIDGYGEAFGDQYGEVKENYPFDGNPDFAILVYPSTTLTNKGKEVGNIYGAEFRGYRDKLLADSVDMFIQQIRLGNFAVDGRVLSIPEEDKTYLWVATSVGSMVEGTYGNRKVIFELNATDIGGDGKTDYFCVVNRSGGILDNRYVVEMLGISANGIEKDIGDLVPFAKRVKYEIRSKRQEQPNTKKSIKQNYRKSKHRN